MKLNTFKFALAGAVYAAGLVAVSTILTLVGVPGFGEFTSILEGFYGFYGYSVSITGIFVGAFWGFIEGYVHLGIFAWLYNRLLSK